MTQKKDIYVNPRDDAELSSCPWLWRVARKILNWIGRDRLPGFFRKVLGVAESPGKLTFQSLQEFPEYRECGVFTILSANLWHDWPRFSKLRERLEAFASLVEEQNSDLVLVQEVIRKPDFQADAWLGKRLSMAYVYSRVNGSEKIGFEEGLGVFSRFPINQLPYLRQLSQSCIPFVRRLVLGTSVETPCGEILAFSAHLGLIRSHNASQIHDLQHWVSRIAKGRTVFVGGDFNAPENTPQIRNASSHWIDTYRMVNRGGRADTHEVKWPWGKTLMRHRLDYIFLKSGSTNWKVVESRHIDSSLGPHSDHRAVLTRLVHVE